jgi:glycosyltransferase involved in cell wall biosynthesis
MLAADMRIGLVVTGGVDRSGRERVTPSLLWLVERLARRHDVQVFVLHYYPESCSYPLLGSTVHDIGRVDGPRGLRRSRQRGRLGATIEAHGPFDVLHAYQGMPAAVSAPIARRLGVPLVVTLDSGEATAIDDIAYGLQRRWFDRRGVGLAVRAAARVTVATEFMAAMTQRALGGTHADVIAIGVDASAFPSAVRVEGPPWRLLRVASINDVKDHPTLLRALSLVVGCGLDVHLDMVGEDTMGGRAQALTRTLDLEARVTFHGFQPTDRLAPFYARAHLHVVSSRHEAAGVVILEAAAAGLATVGTAVGYVADWHSDRAVAVPVQDPAALARAIADVLQDPAQRERLASRAREWTLAHDADWTAEQFERIYAEVIRSG